jgi:transposase
MRYELTDFEWAAIRSFLPNKPRGIPRVDDRRVLNGIFWVLRSGAPWRDLPEAYGPRTTCYNRFVRGRQAGVWDRIMDALAAGHDAAVQMIDTSVVRVHQHGMRTSTAHSGNPALRNPSIISFAFFDTWLRAVHADIVKAGSNSSTPAAASRASASCPRWAKAAARQRYGPG